MKNHRSIFGILIILTSMISSSFQQSCQIKSTLTEPNLHKATSEAIEIAFNMLKKLNDLLKNNDPRMLKYFMPKSYYTPPVTPGRTSCPFNEEERDRVEYVIEQLFQIFISPTPREIKMGPSGGSCDTIGSNAYKTPGVIDMFFIIKNFRVIYQSKK